MMFGVFHHLSTISHVSKSSSSKTKKMPVTPSFSAPVTTRTDMCICNQNARTWMGLQNLHLWENGWGWIGGLPLIWCRLVNVSPNIDMRSLARLTLANNKQRHFVFLQYVYMLCCKRLIISCIGLHLPYWKTTFCCHKKWNRLPKRI